ncbi:MAG: hypothetical protein ACFFBP_17805 [Promethearchaeota archaeon]
MEPKDNEKRLTEEERAQIKALEKIDELIIVQNNHYMLGEYDDAIKITEEIIELAKKDNLLELVKEQEDYIQQMLAAKDKSKRLAALKELSEMKKKKVIELLESGEILKAHEIVEDFKKEYGNEFNLKKIASARTFIQKEEDIWIKFIKKQESLKEEIKILEKLIIKARDENDMIAQSKILDQAKPLVLKYVIEDINEKWSIYEKEHSDFIGIINEEIAIYEEKFLENKENNKLSAAINYCEKIIENAQKSGNVEVINKFTQIVQDMKNQFESQASEKNKILKEIQEKAKQLESAIKVEENTLPLIEEFSINDLLGDITGDINETLDKIGNLLSEHRVEIKKEISNKAVLRSASGEIVEFDKDIEVKEDNEEPTSYSVQSGFTNPFDDIIEEGILTDLVPYNFEITQVTYNGELVPQLPDKNLTKDGLEINWKLENIPPNEKVEVNYDLRRRVSRTIIFILENHLKIIKTHSNLNSIDIEGSYDVKIPFTNSFGLVLNGVVVEDIIPLYYLHFVKEPTKLLPAPPTSSSMGDLIKWNVGKMEMETLNYHYRLLEIYRLEEIKIKVDELDTKGAEALKQVNINEALHNFEQIKNIISNYLK